MASDETKRNAYVSYLSNWPKPQTVKIKKETSKRSVFSPSIIINRTITVPLLGIPLPQSSSNFPVIAENIFRPITKEKLSPPLFLSLSSNRQRKIYASTDRFREGMKANSYCHHPPRREEMTSPPFPGRLNRKTRSDTAQFTRNRITCNYRSGRGGSLSDRWLFRSRRSRQATNFRTRLRPLCACVEQVDEKRIYDET